MKKALVIVAVLALVGGVGIADWGGWTADVKPSSGIAATGDPFVLKARVTDVAGILTASGEAALVRRLAAFEARTRHQLVVVTVPTLKGQDVAVFTLNLAKRSGIGRKSHNDGIVLLVAPNERKVRIEVGLGLEKALPNEACAKILQYDVLPQFRSGDFPAGINAGVTALIERLPVQGG